LEVLRYEFAGAMSLLKNIDSSTIGLPIIGGTPNRVLFIDNSGNLAVSDNFRYTDSTGTLSLLKLGVNTHSPDASAHIRLLLSTLGPHAGPSYLNSAENSNPTNYYTNDVLTYRIYAKYSDGQGGYYYSNTYAEALEITIVAAFASVDLDWDSGAGTPVSYLILRDLNSSGFIYWYDTGNTNLTAYDDNGAGNGITWNTASIPDFSVTTAGVYSNSRLGYDDGFTDWGLHVDLGVYIGGKSFGSFTGGTVGGSLFIRPDLDLFDTDINIFKVGKDDAVAWNGKPFGLDWSNEDTGDSRFKLWNETSFADLGIKDLYGSGANLSSLTASRAVVTDASKNLVSSAVTSTELGYVSGVTSAIQTQLNSKVDEVASTDNAIVRFNGTGGAIQNSGLILDDSNNLIGPSAGFKITGGTSTTADLSFQTTSGVGASGADMHFLVGNNGATEAITILNSGLVGINTLAPSAARLVVTPTSSTTVAIQAIRTGVSSVNPAAIQVINSVGGTAEAGMLIENGGPNDFGVTRMFGTRVSTNDYLGVFEFGDKTSVADNRTAMIIGYAGTASGRGYMSFLTRDAGGFDTNARFLEGGNVDFGFKVFIGGTTTPTAKLHLAAGSTTAATAPLKFTTGTSMTAAEAGAMEYTTDDLFFTISTSTARKRLLMADPVGGLTSGRVPFATTNGRLTDDADLTFLTDTLTATKVSTGTLISTGVVRLQGYTVATLPAGTQGDSAYCTDLLAPTFFAVAVGGGGIIGPVFYNGTNWICT